MGLKYNNTNVAHVKFNGQPIDKVYYNGTLVFTTQWFTHTIKLTTNPLWTSGYCDCELSIDTMDEEPITSWETLINILEQKKQNLDSPTFLVTLTGKFFESNIYQYNNQTAEILPNGEIRYWYTTSYASTDYLSRSVNPVEALGLPPILTDVVTEA